jgi:hypothetical protein
MEKDRKGLIKGIHMSSTISKILQVKSFEVFAACAKRPGRIITDLLFLR